ncbi:MAG: aspartate--tRNA ligase [Actinobacteria bacterium]|nr:aspartate--tRNA ligase [Actinomycetota bacterium]
MTTNKNSTALRTHLCGDLRVENIGQKVTLCGWIGRRREHGEHLAFLDLRDFSGIVQCVVDNSVDVRSEWVIRVTGTVQARPSGTINENIPTGKVELSDCAIEILNNAEPPPFPIDQRGDDVDENVRLKFRYLDIRRERMQKNLRLRSAVNSAIRKSMESQGFTEIETPLLMPSTPEGAREFLVPSRNEPGSFYALPQSPQLWKQLLMVAGIDRYYQIAKCLRDEDLRADRQYEFMQLGRNKLDALTEKAKKLGAKGLVWIKVGEGLVLDSPVAKFLSVDEQADLVRLTNAQAGDLILIVADIWSTTCSVLGQLRNDLGRPPVHEGPYRYVWVVDFPMFVGINPTTKMPQPGHHPFCHPHHEDVDRLESDPLSVRALAYDLVLNGWELGSGSIRIHEPDLQRRVFRQLGISDEDADNRFGFFLQPFKYGAPPHGGFAFGIDRLVAILAGEDNIREVIAFPKTQSGSDPMTNAPTTVNSTQLNELGIRLLPPAAK